MKQNINIYIKTCRKERNRFNQNILFSMCIYLINYSYKKNTRNDSLCLSRVSCTNKKKERDRDRE